MNRIYMINNSSKRLSRSEDKKSSLPSLHKKTLSIRNHE